VKTDKFLRLKMYNELKEFAESFGLDTLLVAFIVIPKFVLFFFIKLFIKIVVKVTIVFGHTWLRLID
jgi:hypothetical protein